MNLSNKLNLILKDYSIGNKESANKKFKLDQVFGHNCANFRDAMVSTAVVEAATKSLKKNFNWQKINLK